MVGISLPVCAAVPQPAGPKLEVVVGGDHHWLPYEGLDTEGRPLGFNIDLMREIGRVMDFRPVFRLGPWDAVRRALEQRQIDVVPMFYSSERARVLDFSEMFAVFHHEIVVRRESAPIAAIEQLAGRSVIVQNRSFAHEHLRRLDLDLELVTVETEADALRLLASGRHDGALVTQFGCRHFIRQLELDNLQAVGPALLPREYCFAVLKGNAELLERLNRGLAILRGTGRFGELHDRWFGPLVAPRTLGSVLRQAAWVVVPLLALAALMLAWTVVLRRQVAARTQELNTELVERQRMVQSLRLSQEQLRLQSAALEAAANAIVITDREGSIQWVNRAFTKLTGYAAHEVIGQNPRLLKSGVQGAEAYAQLWGTILAGQVWHGELVNRRKDGSLYHEEQTITPLLDEAGEVSRFISIKQDVSERKRIEQALHQSEHSFRKAFLDAPFGMIIGTSEGVIRQVNPSFCTMLGYSASELEGKHFSAITHPEDISATAAALRKMTEEKLSTERWEKRYLHKSGSAVWGLVSTSMMLGEGGQPEYSLVQVVDITERKRAEAELASSEAKYRSLFEESKDAIYISNRNAELTDINPAGVELFGYDSKRELLQARIDWDLYWNAEDRQAMAGLIEQRGFIKDVEVVLRNRHGRRVTVLETSNAMRDVAGNIVGYRGILHDITQRRELENQLRLSQRLDAVGRLAGGVAHDFNNMLTAILGYTDLAAMRLASDHPVQTYIAEIGKAAERSSTLTRQLLAFSRQQVLQPRLLDLNGVIRSFAKLLQRTLGEDIELISELAPDLGPVQADPGSIEQILMNLAVNARDAMAGGGKLTIETFNAELDRAYADEHTPVQPGAYVCVAVSDTGAGMDETTRNRIFEPFFTTKERGKGIGLGLSTVYGIVKQSGGYVWVYSEPGQGTSFKIYLPRAGAVEVADQPGSQTVAALRGNETILLVEDDAAVRRLTSEILTESGFRVFPAGGMEEALAICERRAGESIDLLITDIVLPGIGGVDLAQRIAAIRPGIKVLYMSGYADRAVRGQLSEGAVFLSKPFTPAALVSKVRAAIEQPADAS